MIDHLKPTRYHNSYASLFHVFLIASWPLVRIHSVELEFIIVEVILCIWLVVYFVSSNTVEDRNGEMYKLVARLMALDSSDSLRRLRWLTIITCNSRDRCIASPCSAITESPGWYA